MFCKEKGVSKLRWKGSMGKRSIFYNVNLILELQARHAAPTHAQLLCSTGSYIPKIDGLCKNWLMFHHFSAFKEFRVCPFDLMFLIHLLLLTECSGAWVFTQYCNWQMPTEELLFRHPKQSSFCGCVSTFSQLHSNSAQLSTETQQRTGAFQCLSYKASLELWKLVGAAQNVFL